MIATGAALGLLGLGLFWAWQRWRYQESYHDKNYRQASRIWPQKAQAWRKLSLQRLNPAGDANPDLAGALRAAQHAVRDDGADWRNWRYLALSAMESGKMTLTQKAMREMQKHSDGFYARYLYANLLLVNGNTQAYWQNLIPALAIAPARKLPLIFPLLLSAADEHYTKLSRATHKAIELTEKHTLYVSNPGQAFYLSHAYLDFLIQPQQLARAARWWPRVIRYAGPPDRWTRQRRLTVHESGLELLQNAMANGDIPLAMQIWHTGIKMHAWGRLRTAIGLEDGQRIPDGDFMLRLNRRPLAWQACFTCGPYVTRSRINTAGAEPQGYAMRLDFNGGESGRITIAHQWLALSPGKTYRLGFWTRNSSSNSATKRTGVMVIILALQSGNAAWTEPYSISIHPSWQHAMLIFSTPTSPRMPKPNYQIQIIYQRPAGQMPFQGWIALAGFRISPNSNQPRFDIQPNLTPRNP